MDSVSTILTTLDAAITSAGRKYLEATAVAVGPIYTTLLALLLVGLLLVLRLVFFVLGLLLVFERVPRLGLGQQIQLGGRVQRRPGPLELAPVSAAAVAPTIGTTFA